jgi:hypothetical protein
VIDLLLPSTDAGVFVQLVVVTLVFAVLMWATRRSREMRIFVAGGWIMTYGLMALRAVH